MKNCMLIIALLFSVNIFAQVAPPPPPPPPPSPEFKVEGNKVTFTTPDGTVWVIENNYVSKNGQVLVINSNDMDDMENIQDDIDEIKDNMGDLSPESDDYNELMDQLAELEVSLNELQTYGYRMDTPPGDSTSVTVGKWRLVVKENGNDDDVDVSFKKVPESEEINSHYVDNFETEWFLFDLGYNTYLNKDYKVAVDPAYAGMEDLKAFGSWDVNLHIFRSRVNIAHGYLNFNYGLSFEWHNFRYNDSFIILPKQDSVTIEYADAESQPYDFKKNRFSTTHFTLPLSIGFETKPWDTDKSFRMSFGYSPGIMLKGKTKIENDKGTDKVKDDFNLAPFRHEANYLIGYGDFNVYASYDVNSMFIEGEGPELHPFSVGLVIRHGF